MSADPELEYLTTRQVAERIGIKPKSVRMALWRGLMPEPDLIMFGNNLWQRETIDRWLKTRGKKKRKHKRTRRQRLHAAPRRTYLPRNARIAPSDETSSDLPPVSTVSPDIAATIAAEIRHEGDHCVSRDVIELAGANPDLLDFDRRKLQQRIQRKIRGLKSRS